MLGGSVEAFECRRVTSGMLKLAYCFIPLEGWLRLQIKRETRVTIHHQIRETLAQNIMKYDTIA